MTEAATAADAGEQAEEMTVLESILNGDDNNKRFFHRSGPGSNPEEDGEDGGRAAHTGMVLVSVHDRETGLEVAVSAQVAHAAKASDFQMPRPPKPEPEAVGAVVGAAGAAATEPADEAAAGGGDDDGGDGSAATTAETPAPRPAAPARRTVFHLYKLQHLPPLELHFSLPANYPSKASPAFTLTCKWLTPAQLSQLAAKMDELWLTQMGEPVLFNWVQFLENDARELLGLRSPWPLRVANPLRQMSRDVRQDSVVADETDGAEATAAAEAAAAAQRQLSTASASASAGPSDPRVIQDAESRPSLLRALLIYDSEEIERQFRDGVYDCEVCFESKTGEDCVRFSACQHIFCRECISGYFASQVQDGAVRQLVCPNPECKKEALQTEIKDILDKETYEKYERFLLERALDEMDDVVSCPRLVCQKPVIVENDSTLGHCRACEFRFCVLCQRAWHGVNECSAGAPIGDGSIDVIELYIKADDDEKKRLERKYGARRLQQSAAERLSHEYLSEVSQACPKCGLHIHKTDGCNKMICGKCHTPFCWLCLTPLNKLINPYDHFNGSSSCAGLLFQGNHIGNDDDQMEEWWDEDEEEDDWDLFG